MLNVQGKDGEKHHVRSVLNLCFVAKSREREVGNGYGNKSHKMSALGEKVIGDCQMSFPNSV